MYINKDMVIALKICIDNYNQDIEYENVKDMPDAIPLNLMYEGFHLFGYLLKPGAAYDTPHPCVLMFHGFPGYTTNNDLEYALMRMGCVVIHFNHRGAWGSDGYYWFSNLVDDAVAIAEWVHNPVIMDRYQIDPDRIFMVGHSMGGMTALNAVKHLDFIRAVAAIAPYDLKTGISESFEKELYEMIEGEGQYLKMTSVSALFDNARENAEKLALINTYDHLKDKNVLFVGADSDTVAPPNLMIEPVYKKLQENPGSGTSRYVSLKTNHGLCGQRTVLAKTIGGFLSEFI